MDSSKWRLLNQHLKDLSRLNSRSEVLVLWVLQLVQELELEYRFIKTGNLSLENQDISDNLNEELGSS